MLIHSTILNSLNCMSSQVTNGTVNKHIGNGNESPNAALHTRFKRIQVKITGI
jgi:hypothetical protein